MTQNNKDVILFSAWDSDKIIKSSCKKSWSMWPNCGHIQIGHSKLWCYGIAPQSDGYFHDQISTGAYYFSWLSKNLSFISKTVLSEWDMQSILPSLAPYIKRDSDSWELASKEILSKHGFFFFNWYFLLWKEPVQLTNIIPFLCGR